MNVASVLESSSGSVLSESSSSGVVLDSLPQHFPRVEGTGFCGAPVAAKKKSPVASLRHHIWPSSVSYLIHGYVPLELAASEVYRLLSGGGVVGGGGVGGGGGHERTRFDAVSVGNV